MRPNHVKQRRNDGGSPNRPFRPRLESLEDRATPATIIVTTTLDVVDPGDGKRSLREAIIKANETAGTDVIILPAGVYKLAAATPGESDGASDLDITGAETIQGAGAGRTIIDAQQRDRVFDVLGTGPNSIKVLMQGLTIRNGNVAGDGGGIRIADADLVVRESAVSANRASLSGGGISCRSVTGGGDVKLIRSTVSRNVAGANGGGGLVVIGNSLLTVIDSTVRRNITNFYGGGILASAAKLTNCTVSGNYSGNSGGGIATSFTATLNNCIVSGNIAKSAGGGIQADTATLTNTTVSGNKASVTGGGIDASTATLINSTISGNSAGGDGGGIASTGTATLLRSTLSGNSAITGWGGGINASTATLTNSTINGNTANGNGGGIAASNPATLTNCTVSGNSSSEKGGGIYATHGSLLNCTVVENIANLGGGIFHNPGSDFTVKNSIVALNLTDFAGVGPDAFGDFLTGGHNLIGNDSGSAGFINGALGDMVGTTNAPIDPNLGPLANNGGRTKTHALLAGSKAIDRGDNSLLPPTDQRGAGFPRVKDGTGDGVAIVDIGAFER